MVTVIEMTELPASGSAARIFEGAHHEGVNVSFFLINRRGFQIETKVSFDHAELWCVIDKRS